MRKGTLLTLVAAVAFAGAFAASAQNWPAGDWQVAVISTGDAEHEAGASAEIDGSMISIVAGGDDIWNEADQLTYVYKEASGDFDVSAVVHSIELTNDWAKAGIMARQDLSPGSVNVLASPRGANDLVTFQWRPEADGGSSSERLTPDGAVFPVGVRLMKSGTSFSGDWGEGGPDWSGNPVTRDGVTPTPPLDVEFSDPYLLGIAVTSHEVGVLTTAVVEVLGDSVTAVEAEGKLATTWATIRSIR